MLTAQFRHEPKSTAVFLAVALFHVALLYLLSVQGGLWITPPVDTQPLTVSFVTERATANNASKNDTLDTSRNTQEQKKTSQRSPETKASKPNTTPKKTPNVESSQSDLITPTKPASKTVDAESIKPAPEKPPLTENTTQQKQPQNKVDTVTETNSAINEHKPVKSQTNTKRLGRPNMEPFLHDAEPQYQAIINPPVVRELEKTDPKTSDEYNDYDTAVKSILDDVDEFTTEDAGQAKANAKKDSNWGKLTSSEDSRVEALYKNRVKADYPEEEWSDEREGIVIFEFKIDRQGKAIEDSINVVNSTTDNFLREATIALLASEFEVTISKQGVFLNENVKIAITFSLDEYTDEDEFPF